MVREGEGGREGGGGGGGGGGREGGKGGKGEGGEGGREAGRQGEWMDIYSYCTLGAENWLGRGREGGGRRDGYSYIFV